MGLIKWLGKCCGRNTQVNNETNQEVRIQPNIIRTSMPHPTKIHLNRIIKTKVEK